LIILKKYGKLKQSAETKKLRRENKKSLKKRKLNNLKKKKRRKLKSKETNLLKLPHLQVHLLLPKLLVVLRLKNH